MSRHQVNHYKSPPPTPNSHFKRGGSAPRTLKTVLTLFLTIKTSFHNISITLSQISLKIPDHRGGYWQFPVIFQFSDFLVPDFLCKLILQSIPLEHFDNYQNCSKLKTLVKVQIGKMPVCLFWQQERKPLHLCINDT